MLADCWVASAVEVDDLAIGAGAPRYSLLCVGQRKRMRSFCQLPSAEAACCRSFPSEPPAALHDLVVAPRHPCPRPSTCTTFLLLSKHPFTFLADTGPRPQLHWFARGGGKGWVCGVCCCCCCRRRCCHRLSSRLCVGDRQLKHRPCLIVVRLCPSSR